MKKYSHLDSSLKLSQLQGRLNKNPYLSKSSVPTGADAKIFLFFQRLRKIPKKSTHPNLYHWYILMKQFSVRTLQIWEEQHITAEEERFVNDYIQFESSNSCKENNHFENNVNREQKTSENLQKKCQYLSTPKNSSKIIRINANEDGNQPNFLRTISYNTSSLKLIPGEVAVGNHARIELNSPMFQIQYVMEMQLKGGMNTPVQVLRERLQEEKLELLSLDGEDENIRVVFKAEPGECERLKDRISQWEEISNLQFRKEKRMNNNRTENKSERTILSPNIITMSLAN